MYVKKILQVFAAKPPHKVRPVDIFWHFMLFNAVVIRGAAIAKYSWGRGNYEVT